MNNKKLGTQFEKEVVDMFDIQGYWVHFIQPAPNGSQPFDIIAMKGAEVVVADCKTSSIPRFSFNRLEENQKFAFESVLRKCDCVSKLNYDSNESGVVRLKIIVKYDGKIYSLDYEELKEKGVIDLRDEYFYKVWDKETNTLKCFSKEREYAYYYR